MTEIHNWAETYRSSPRDLRYVDTVRDLVSGLAAAHQAGVAVRVLGAAQSPSDIAMSDETLLAVRGLNAVRAIDRERCEVIAEAGITLGELSVALARHGLALPNLGSILRQTLGGAVATGTHGTGLLWGSTPTWVQSFEMVTPDGTLVEASSTQEPELFAAGRLNLGSLGVMTAFRLKVVPAFDLHVEEGPVDLARAMHPDWYGAADHARVWYLPYVGHAWGWRAFRVRPGSAAPSTPATRDRLFRWFNDRLLGYHAFQAGLWLAASYPRLLPGINRAYSRRFLTHPRSSTGGSVEQFTFDCLFHQRVTEWAIPMEHAHAAALGVRNLAEEQGFHAHLPVEIRFTAGDDIWLSPTYGGPRCWIGIVSYIPWGREIEWRPWFAAFEQQMLGYGGRPHWAKEFSAGPSTLAALYPMWGEFARLRRKLDPRNSLRNAYTDRTFGR